MALSEVSKNLLSLVLRRVCPSCGGSIDYHKYLCEWCSLRIDACGTVHRSSDGLETQSVSSCRCEERSGGIPVYSAVFYRGLPGELILRLKYNGEKHLAAAAAGIIHSFASVLPGPEDILVPIPASRKRRRERGYNQVELITDKLSAITGSRIRRLLKRDNRPSQVGLPMQLRRKNVSGAFHMRRCGKVSPELKLWLIDDLATTCSTMDSAANTLLEAGFTDITGLTLAYRKKTGGSMIKPDNPEKWREKSIWRKS
ncbi:MAG: hypothetical protein GF388_06875 [Candidatus Aegiribacteria sp.]|nr:hypothetical protein [Candidatus Aegiribacteria sp.]MBD3294869.1 hypothetical protein [Candidatus Fermentibacteria bacterium]